MTMTRVLAAAVFALFAGWLALSVRADVPVVGLIPKSQRPIVVDGKLDEWEGAWVTPLNSTHPNFANRATHIYYLWDDDALYIGVRALDEHLSHISPITALYDGDALEFYLDCRQGDQLGGKDWGPGTVHMFFTAVTGHEIRPRWHVRDLPAFKDLGLKGVEIAGVKTPNGYTMEFKLPWSNLGFKPAAGTPIEIDIEMGSADGGHRVHRTFAYSSPTSVGTPSTAGRVMLVDRVDPLAVVAYSRALFPLDITTPGNYGRVYATGCLSPTIANVVTNVNGKLLDADGKQVKGLENPAFSTVAGFWRLWHGEWETYDLKPGIYTAILTATNSQGRTIVERTRKLLIE